jgi:hypothetical protein
LEILLAYLQHCFNNSVTMISIMLEEY